METPHESEHQVEARLRAAVLKLEHPIVGLPAELGKRAIVTRVAFSDGKLDLIEVSYGRVHRGSSIIVQTAYLPTEDVESLRDLVDRERTTRAKRHLRDEAHEDETVLRVLSEDAVASRMICGDVTVLQTSLRFAHGAKRITLTVVLRGDAVLPKSGLVGVPIESLRFDSRRFGRLG